MADTQYQVLTGDPNVLYQKGLAYQQLADKITKSMAYLEKLANEDKTVSDAISEIRELSYKVKDDISKTATMYKEAGDALLQYSGELWTAKDVADRAAWEIARLRGGQGQLVANRDNAKAGYQNAKWRYEEARDASTYDASTVDYWRRKMNDRKAEWDNAQSAIDNNASDIAYQERRWTNNNWQGGGKELKDVAGARAVGAFNKLFGRAERAGFLDTAWDKIGKWAEQAYKIFKTICDIASVLSLFLAWVPFLGPALLLLATISKVLSLVEAVVSIVSAVVQIARGELSGWAAVLTVGLAALTLVTSKVSGARISQMKKAAFNMKIPNAAKVLKVNPTNFMKELGNSIKKTMVAKNPFKVTNWRTGIQVSKSCAGRMSMSPQRATKLLVKKTELNASAWIGASWRDLGKGFLKDLKHPLAAFKGALTADVKKTVGSAFTLRLKEGGGWKRIADGIGKRILYGGDAAEALAEVSREVGKRALFTAQVKVWSFANRVVSVGNTLKPVVMANTVDADNPFMGDGDRRLSGWDYASFGVSLFSPGLNGLGDIASGAFDFAKEWYK